MDYGLLFRKTSTCYSNPDIEYLDETSDYKLKVLAKKRGVSLEELKVGNDRIRDGIAYLTKEKHGRVYAGGFLRDALLGKRCEAPEKWGNELRKKAITSAIFKNMREYGAYRGSIGHKLVFSLSQELEERMDSSHLNVDEILAKEVKKVMYSFQKKFHKGEKIGFAWGIHHDTKHRHIHVYLCNRTDKGTHVAMSSPLKGRSRKYYQKDQLGYIKDQLVLSQKRILTQVKKAQNGLIPEKISESVITGLGTGRSDGGKFAAEEKRLEEVRLGLIEKQQDLDRRQDEVRRRWNDYFVQKTIVEMGYNKVKRMNRELEESYLKLRQSKSVVSYSLLNQLGLLPKSGPVKDFFRVMQKLQYSQNRAHREALIQKINADKEFKIRLQNQLKIIDWQRELLRKDLQKRKEEKARLQKEYYQSRYQYEKDLLKHRYMIFMDAVSDKGLRDRYYKVTRQLWFKRRSRLDSSVELQVLRDLDKVVLGLRVDRVEKKKQGDDEIKWKW